jgi:hypothetical protein
VSRPEEGQPKLNTVLVDPRIPLKNHPKKQNATNGEKIAGVGNVKRAVNVLT